MPITGTGASSRSANRPGSPKQAMITASAPLPSRAYVSSTAWPAMAAAAREVM